MRKSVSTSKDRPLFTPGPLTTSLPVKLAMLRDLGSRDNEFLAIVREIRTQLLSMGGVCQEDGYETVLMQGSGTFGVEAVITCAIPPDGKWLVVINGAYGDRIAKMCTINHINFKTIKFPENSVPNPIEIDNALSDDPTITAVAIIHCETTTGIINPIEEIGRIVKKHGKTYFIDSMSAFGAIEFDLQACGADFLVSSANKCIEGVPGFSFCLCKKKALLKTKGWSRTLSLDLYEQWLGLETNGQFRFTPPTHGILAFKQALNEHLEEGGVAGRAVRYKLNRDTLKVGMDTLGFEEYLEPEHQSYIITSYRYPKHPNFEFETFYHKLNEHGFVIYPGKVSNSECFRIGTVGRIFPSDVQSLLQSVKLTLEEMDIYSLK